MKKSLLSSGIAALPLLSIFLCFPAANAATLLEWNNYTTSPSYAPGTPIPATNIIGGTWSFGSGVSAGAFGSGTAIVAASGVNGSSIGLNDYFEFSIAPESGYILDLETINLGYRGSAGGTLTLRSSLDAFASNLVTPFSPGNGVSTPITLSSAFEDLASSVSFRVYLWNSGGAGSVLGLSNLDSSATNVLGTVVAVPEPSPAIVFGIGIGVLFLLRRRALRRGLK